MASHSKIAYIEYLCHELGQVPRGQNRRLIVSLPPRHLKTFTCSICLPAYILGRQPAAKVLVITYGENLAADIAHGIRELLRASWFKAAFSTRLAADRNRVNRLCHHGGRRGLRPADRRSGDRIRRRLHHRLTTRWK